MSLFLIPIVVLVFAGSAVAEEANWGTLRYLLVRPVSRTHLLTAKLAVAVLLGASAILLVLLSGLLQGVIAFGWHPVVTPSFATLGQWDAVGRLFLAAGYIAWSMAGMIALGFLLSTITTSSMGAVSGAMGATIVSQILGAIQPLKDTRSILPTQYWRAWETLFSSQVDSEQLVRGILLQVPYVALFLFVTWWYFNHKDITT